MARNGFPVPGRGNQLNAAAGRRTTVAAGQVFNAPGGAPGIRGTPAGRLLSRAAGKNRAARRQKNRPFYHLLHRKGGQLPDEKCDALPLRAEKLSLPQSGDSDLEVAQRAAGVIRLATLCAQSQKRILELERELASQSEELVDLQAHPFFNLRDKYRDQILFWGWGMGFLCFIYWMLVS
ncbi:MAG: hypothetical protein E6Y28_07990 [Staphylococcus epidermidis]|nr:hypothetical protein [Staphylococcus epidermidis]